MSVEGKKEECRGLSVEGRKKRTITLRHPTLDTRYSIFHSVLDPRALLLNIWMLLMEDVCNTWERINGNDRDLVVERVLLMAGVNHPQVLETQVLNGSVHG